MLICKFSALKSSLRTHQHLSAIILALSLPLLLSSCSSTSQNTSHTSEPINQAEINQASSAKKAWILASHSDYSNAQNALIQINSQQTLNPATNASIETLQDSVYFVWANAILSEQFKPIALSPAQNKIKSLSYLNFNSIQANIDSLPHSEQIAFWRYKAELQEHYLLFEDAIKSRVYIEHLQLSNNNTGDSLFQSNQVQLWTLLSQLDKQQIYTLQKNSRHQSNLYAWIDLAQIILHSNLNLEKQIAAIDAWQLTHSNHPAALIPPSDIGLIRNALRARPTHIAIILPMHGKYRAVGEAIRDGILYNFYNSDYKPSLSFYSTNETDDFLSTYQAAVDDGANWIIGPLLKPQLEALYTLDKLAVTTLALNRIESDTPPPEGLIEYSLSSNDEINSLIPLMIQQNADRVIVLAQKANWAEDTSQYFSEQWQALDHEPLGTYFFESSRAQANAVQQALLINHSKQRIKKMKWLIGNELEVQERRRKDVDSILILSRPQQAASLRPLLAFYYASDLGMYSTSNIYRGYPNKSIDNDLRGIQFTDTPIAIHPADRPNPYYEKSPFIRMYGLGLDVFSITERYSLLSQLDHSQFYGATGVIGVKQNTLSRTTDYAFFKSGRVYPLVNDQSANP